MSWRSRHGFGSYVTAAQKRVKAELARQKLEKKGQKLSPVLIEGRSIATTFWGKAWCENVEAYQDFAYRLERGRSYVRGGAVLDLRLTRGAIEAKVSGTSIYEVSVSVKAVPRERWEALTRACAGKIGSLVELLSGKLSKEVMAVLCRRPEGLFPAPKEISFECSCPDYASLCKHIAAVLYGVGNRLDREPALLFLLRGVDQQELIANASAAALTSPRPGAPGGQRLSGENLAGLFGIELDEAELPPATAAPAAAPKPPAMKPGRGAQRGQASPQATAAPNTGPAKASSAPPRRTRAKDSAPKPPAGPAPRKSAPAPTVPNLREEIEPFLDLSLGDFFFALKSAGKERWRWLSQVSLQDLAAEMSGLAALQEEHRALTAALSAQQGTKPEASTPTPTRTPRPRTPKPAPKPKRAAPKRTPPRVKKKASTPKRRR
jgi:hypothetical protein